jgi:hypothetical protein
MKNSLYRISAAALSFCLLPSFLSEAHAQPTCMCRPVQDTWGNKKYLAIKTPTENPKVWVFTCDYICNAPSAGSQALTVTATYRARRGWFSNEPAETDIRCEGIYYRSRSLPTYPYSMSVAESMHGFDPKKSKSDTLQEWAKEKGCQ